MKPCSLLIATSSLLLCHFDAANPSSYPTINRSFSVYGHGLQDKAFFLSLISDLKKHTYYPYSVDLYLKSFRLYECHCSMGMAGSHCRFMSDNTRTKMENLIVGHVSSHSMTSIRMLSLGAGGCLQDLILVIRLALLGLTSIHLEVVDTSFDNDAYFDLVRLLKKLAEAYEISITTNSSDSVTKIDAKRGFNLVYAIDYENHEPCLGLESLGVAEFLHTNANADTSTTSSRGTIDLIKAANLATSPNALVVMSYGKNIISLTPNTASSTFSGLKLLSQIYRNQEPSGSFYLNADISNLLVDLQCLVRLKRPLLINRDIVSEEDRDSVNVFLARLGLPPEFTDDAAVIAAFGEKSEGKCLVLDYTKFDPREGEAPVPQMYQSPNLSIVRIDSSKSTPGDTHVAVYPGPSIFANVADTISYALSGCEVS